MLIERCAIATGWQWRVVETMPEPSCKRLTVGHWHILVVGSYHPAMPGWLEQGIRYDKPPTDLLKTVWERYDGHCAVALLNDREDVIIVGVDPYAIAKVYVHSDGERWLIGTRLPELLRFTSDAPLPVCPQACTYFFLNGYTPAWHTFYSDVTKIPPGTILTVQSGKSSQVSYLDIEGPMTVPGDEYLAQVRENLENSLRCYLNAFESHHVALSGGVDSTTLLASLLRLGADRHRCVAKTAVSVGRDNVVLNPFDRDFAIKVATEYGVKHELVPYHWSDKHVLADFRRTVEDLGTEDGIGSLMFQALAPSSYTDKVGFYAAQNVDSIFSFASIGWPMLKARPPFIAGLGGWVTRFNLFGGLDRSSGIEGVAVKILLGLYLHRHYQVHVNDRTVVDRMFGMTFNPLKWPVHLNEQNWPYIANVAGLATWFEREYILEPNLLSLFEQNPHGAFVWLFLHNYMQGTANRATAWPTSLSQAPSFLPFASLGILRLTAKLIPNFWFHWFGKYAILWMARRQNLVPKYVIQRSDPATPDLDRLMFTTFFSNPDVYDYLHSFIPREAKTRFDGIIEATYLNQLIAQFENKRFDEANLSLLLRICWLLTSEQSAWG